MADRPPKDKIQVEPSPKLREFAEWLIDGFYGPSDYPEKIEVRIVYGPRLASLGPIVKQVLYPPNMVEGTIGEDDKDKPNGKNAEKRRSKPNREELVGLANEISARCQNDCDGNGRDTAYAVRLIHFQRDDDAYERWVLKKKPAVPKSRGELDGEDEDGEYGGGGIARLEGQRLGHHERMFSMVGGMLEALVDRQDRIIERQEAALASANARLERQQEITERALSLEHERAIKRDWENIKIKSVERGIDLFQGLAPSFMGMITGKKIDGITESPESLTLKFFFKHEKEGGKMSDAQLDAAFGAFDDSPEQKQIRPGVLSVDQGRVLYDVAQCRVPSTDLEKLLPDGELELSQEQLVRLQSIFTPEQLTPIIAMIGMVMQRRQSRQAQQTQHAHQPQP